MSAQAIHENIESCDYLHIEYSREPHVYTQLKTQHGETVGQGLCRIGNVIVFPYGHMISSYMPLLNPVRRELLAAALREEETCPTMVYDTQYVTVNDFVLDEGARMLLVTNYSTDPVHHLRLHLPYEADSVMAVDRENGQMVKVELCRQNGETVLNHSVEPLSSACFILK